MKWLIMLLLVPLLLGLGALMLNHPPLFDSPGPKFRLQHYLTTNVAETRVDHELAELRPRRLNLPESEARARIRQALRKLRWLNVSEEPEAFYAVVETPLLRFNDDIRIRLEPEGEQLLVQLRSASRVGRGDFAANTRHILDFYQALFE
jgi:uncharacterized protein (DUF1499 family)